MGVLRGRWPATRVRRGDEGGPVHTIPIFQQDFNIEYPSSHPVTVDEMSESSFVRRCTDEISDVIGRHVLQRCNE